MHGDGVFGKGEHAGESREGVCDALLTEGRDGEQVQLDEFDYMNGERSDGE